MENQSLNEIIELFKTIIEKQSSDYVLLITVFLIIIGALLTLTWLWNFIFSKRDIRSQVEKRLGEEIIKKWPELEKKITEIVEEKIKSMERKIIILDADLSRRYAATSYKNEFYHISLRWWIQALKGYIQLNAEKPLRVATEAIFRILEENKIKKEDLEEMGEEFDFKDAEEVINKTPKILDREKRKILKKLKELKK